MTRYTPTLEEIKRHWGVAVDMHRRPERLEEFDRWLNEIRAEAWDEGFNAGEEDVYMHEIEGYDTECLENPHRNFDND